MITVNTTKSAKESTTQNNVTLKSSDSSLLNMFVKENPKYSIEMLKAGTYDAIFSRITFDDGIPVFKVFDRFNDGDDDYYEDDVWRIKLSVPNDVPVAKGRNNSGLEEYWVPFNGGWAWVDPIPPAHKFEDLSKKLSKEAQQELKNAKYAYRSLGPNAERIVLKTLLDFEKTVTNGKYFNGNSIASNSADMAKLFNQLSADAVVDNEDRYPNLTMAMTDVKAWYNLDQLDPEAYADYLYVVFDVDCTDSNGNSFRGRLVGRSNIYYPEPGELCYYDHLIKE